MSHRSLVSKFMLATAAAIAVLHHAASAAQPPPYSACHKLSAAQTDPFRLIEIDSDGARLSAHDLRHWNLLQPASRARFRYALALPEIAFLPPFDMVGGPDNLSDTSFSFFLSEFPCSTTCEGIAVVPRRATAILQPFFYRDRFFVHDTLIPFDAPPVTPDVARLNLAFLATSPSTPAPRETRVIVFKTVYAATAPLETQKSNPLRRALSNGEHKFKFSHATFELHNLKRERKVAHSADSVPQHKYSISKCLQKL